MALALALVAAAPPLVIHNGWPGLAAAVAAVVYAAYLLLGKRWTLRRKAATPRPGPALSATARAFGRLLADDGFDRDRYVFRRTNTAGDTLMVDFHPLPAPDGETRFAVHVGFLLAPFWAWQKHTYGYPPSQRPDLSHVNWLQPVTPDDGAGLWTVTSEADAAPVAARIRERLPDLLLWLDRDLLWRAAMGSSTELGSISVPLKVWLLVERGQSEELRELLDEDDGDVWDFAKRRTE